MSAGRSLRAEALTDGYRSSASFQHPERDAVYAAYCCERSPIKRDNRAQASTMARTICPSQILDLVEILHQHQVVHRGIELGIRQPFLVGRDADVQAQALIKAMQIHRL